MCFASAIVAALPLLVIAILLAVLRRPPWQAAVAAAGTAAALAWAVWGMPAQLTLAAFTQGMAFGLWPISWVVFSAVFFYNLSVAGGDFDVIRRSLSHLTTDRRLLALLVAFGFGALVEGIAGFGAPVAITASMLVGLGFEPISAAVLALVANTAPVAFGSLGIPVTTLGGLLAPILGRDVESTTMALSAMVGRQLPFFSVIIPAYLVVLLSGWRGMLGVFPAVLVAGVSFAAAQFVVSNLIGPELTDTIAALCSIGALALLLRVWRPRDIAAAGGSNPRGHGIAAEPADAPGRVARAFATYGILVVVVLVGQVGNFGSVRRLPPPVNVTALLRCGQPGNAQCPDPWVGNSAAIAPQGFRFPVWDFQWPGSYTWSEGKPVPLIRRAPPVAAAVTPYPLTYRLDFLASAGTLVFMAGVIAFVVMLIRGVPRSAFGVGVPRHRRAASPARRDDRVHPVDLDGHELLRHDVVHGAGAGVHGVAVPVLLGVPGHARRLPDRQRHLVEHPVRAAAGDDREGVGPGSDPDGRHQQLGRRDGQDDQPAEPLGGCGRRRGRRA